MDPNDSPRQAQRETFLASLLAIMLASGAFLFLVLLCGGPTLAAMVLLVFGVVALGFVNYLLWGRSLSQGVAGEREALEEQERAAEEEWLQPPPRHPRF